MERLRASPPIASENPASRQPCAEAGHGLIATTWVRGRDAFVPVIRLKQRLRGLLRAPSRVDDCNISRTSNSGASVVRSHCPIGRQLPWRRRVQAAAANMDSQISVIQLQQPGRVASGRARFSFRSAILRGAPIFLVSDTAPSIPI